MDKVEFVIRPTKKDLQGAYMKRMLMSRFVRIYWASLCAGVITGAILAEVGAEGSLGQIATWIGLGCLFAMILPIGVPRGLAQQRIKRYERHGEIRLFMGPDGYGGSSDISEFHLKWEGIRSIRETRKYVFLTTVTDEGLIIFKDLLPSETLQEIKAVLANAPVSDKNLLKQSDA